MKTKITTLLMIFAFLVTSVALADGQPKSSTNNPIGTYLGPPIETPRPVFNSIESQIAIYFVELFYTDTREITPYPYMPKKSFKAKKPITD